MLTHEPELGGYSYGIQISENTLGVLMSSQDFGDASELLIWDWKTGTLHLVRAPTRSIVIVRILEHFAYAHD